MALVSFSFLLFIFSFLALYQLLNTTWRSSLLLIYSLIFTGSYLNNAISLFALLIVVFAGYSIAHYAMHKKKVNSGIVVYLFVAIIAFLFIRKYSIVNLVFQDKFLNHSIFIIGYSYILFRQIHVIVDCAQGTIQELPLPAYLAYLLSFLTLLAGPIQRYQHFYTQWQALEQHDNTLHSSLQALNRIASGYIELVVLAPLFASLPDTLTTIFSLSERAYFVVNLYSYPLFLYFNFAGYCSIVIGFGLLIGFQIPENFDKPHLSVDPIDFWSRWHITLSEWLRDYIFTPIYKAGAYHFPTRGMLFAVVGYFITFFIAGIWHGSTLNYLVLGFVFGIGTAATKLFENIIKSRYGRAGYKKLYRNKTFRIIATIFTAHFTALAFRFVETDQVASLLSRL